jgi:hypothetical protein
MKKWTYGLAAAAALVPAAGLAAGSTVALDAYYVIPEFELDIQGIGEATFDEGDGLGVKGRFELTPQVFVAGEYQSNTYDEVEGVPIDAEINLIRGGAGFRLGPGSPMMVSPQIGLFADYRNTSLEDDDTEDELTLSDVRVGLRILLQ